MASIDELMLPHHARCVLSRLRCSGHSFLLNSYLARIESPSLAVIRCRTPLVSFCTVQLRSLCPLALWRLSASLQPLLQTLKSCPGSGVPCSSVMSRSFGRGRVTTTSHNLRVCRIIYCMFLGRCKTQNKYSFQTVGLTCYTELHINQFTLYQIKIRPHANNICAASVIHILTINLSFG